MSVYTVMVSLMKHLISVQATSIVRLCVCSQKRTRQTCLATHRQQAKESLNV